MTPEEISKILETHKNWLNCAAGGERAYLRGANLSGAYLRGAKLSGANLSGANLSDANLSRANLSGANLDYSAWPLWCGSLDVKTDRRIAAQLAYHFCRLDCDDPDYIAAKKAIAAFANTFHRVAECGRIAHESHKD